MLEQGVVVPYGQRVGLAVVGLALRSRRLARSAMALADRGEWLEAQILLRTLLEYVITIEWIALDPARHVLSWWQADEKSFAAMVREVTAITGQRVELPAEAAQQHDELRGQIAAEAEAAGAPAYPSLQQRAAAVAASLGYSLLFRSYSQGGVHPYRQAVLALLEDLPERGGVLVRAAPAKGPTDDPYYLAGVLLVIALERLDELEPGLGLDGIQASKQEFLAIKGEIDARA